MSRGYAIEFPDFDRGAEIDMLIAAGWTDQSWHNDACPRVVCGSATLWIDYADAAKSEVAALIGSAGQCQLEFDDENPIEYLPNGDGGTFATIKEALGALYVDWVGYNPFIDDPASTVEEIAKVFPEYVAEVTA